MIDSAAISIPQGPRRCRPRIFQGRIWMLLAALVLLGGQRLSAAAPEPMPLEQRPLVRHGTPAKAETGQTQSPANGFGLGRVLLSLAAVVGLILLMRWGGAKFFKGQGGPQSAGVMQVVARSALAPRQQLMLVRVGRRLVVVGNSGGELTALSQITDPDEVAELLGQLKRGSESSLNPFASMFSRAESDYAESESAAEPEREPAAAERPGDISETSPVALQSELKGLLEKVRGMAKQFR